MKSLLVGLVLTGCVPAEMKEYNQEIQRLLRQAIEQTRTK